MMAVIRHGVLTALFAVSTGVIPGAFGHTVSAQARVDTQSLAKDVVIHAFALRTHGTSANRDAFVDQYVKSFKEGFERDPRGAEMLKVRPDVLEIAVAAARREAGVQHDKIVMPAIESALTNFYASRFSLDELEELAAYYRTPQAERFLQSFTASESERDAAQNDPVVTRFRASSVGQKETAMSADLAQTMVEAMIETAPETNEVILPKIQSAMQAALTRPPASQ